MGAPYSLDLRERVVAAVAGGMSRAAAAHRFGVSRSSAIRWTKRAEETGSPAALPMGGKKPFALAGEAAWIGARLAEKPDLTGRELLAELNRRGVAVSYYGVWHFLDHAGLSFKKRMARPVCKGKIGWRAGLHQRIRSRGLSPGQDGFRALRASQRSRCRTPHF
jgi:transposase